jgi:serine/threonine-protein kinase HipA
MHLKNYSLVETAVGMRLSPAYDLVSTVLAIPDDSEESALTINGKKSRLTKEDFAALAKNLGISEAAYKKIPTAFLSAREKMYSVLDSCFLPKEMKCSLRKCVDTRMNVLFGA